MWREDLEGVRGKFGISFSIGQGIGSVLYTRCSMRAIDSFPAQSR